MPLIIIQMIASLKIYTPWSISDLILKLNFIAADNAQFDVIGRALFVIEAKTPIWIKGICDSILLLLLTNLSMEKNCIFGRCLKLKVNIS